MFQELEPHDFARVGPLFEGFDYSLSLPAAIAGNNPGRIFVDDVAEPRTALALTVEGYLLAGEHRTPATNEALRRLFAEQLFSGKVYVNGDRSLSLAVHPEEWEARLPALIPGYEPTKNERYHYLCRAVRLDWRRALPQGYRVRRVDHALLHDGAVLLPEAITDALAIEDCWRTEEDFLTKGVSFVALHGREAVAVCMCDCVAGERMDVGIYTQPEHRRQGVAAATVAATVAYALDHGFRAVGWHCNADNVGSCKTAEKVGFERQRTYAYYYYLYDPVDHLAEVGWYHYRHGDYAQTVRCYEQVFAQRADNPDYYYHLAASACALLGDRERARDYLIAAVAHGWAQLEWSRQQPEFAGIAEEEWERIAGHGA